MTDRNYFLDVWHCTCDNVNPSTERRCAKCGAYKRQAAGPLPFAPDTPYRNPCQGCPSYGKGPCYCTLPHMAQPMHIYYNEYTERPIIYFSTNSAKP